jgi:hypothetical protein
MSGEYVIVLVGPDHLPVALAALHRAGYGPNARVFDPARGELAGQLRRAGVAPEGLPSALGEGEVAVGVQAAGRAMAVVSTLIGAGVERVYLVARDGQWRVATASSAETVGPPRSPSAYLAFEGNLDLDQSQPPH